MPAPDGSARAITPYTAPEVVQGHPADARSDIFSFGAILFEMFTGRQAFDGETRATLAANLTKAPTPASGSAGVDRLLRKCLSKNPEMRSSRMEMIILELKLLSVAARRADQVPDAALPRDPAEDSEAARGDMQELEARLAARLQVHERAVAEMHRSANEAVSSLRLKVAAMNGELATTHQHAANRTVAGLDDAAAETILAKVDRGFEALNARMAQIERTVEEMRRHASQFEHNIAADLVDIEQSLNEQSTSIESTRTATSQTDDLWSAWWKRWSRCKRRYRTPTRAANDPTWRQLGLDTGEGCLERPPLAAQGAPNQAVTAVAGGTGKSGTDPGQTRGRTRLSRGGKRRRLGTGRSVP